MRYLVAGGLLVAIALAGLLSPYASSQPDGLERVATDHGIAEREREHALSRSPVADYAVRGVEDDRMATGLAGVLGVVLTFGVGVLLFGALKALRPRTEDG
ncbi:MAG TPA: PDGLE domain-containing protein [Actinomycetota bacterium]|nr:PDGLE domain-containing protein [Actinomycetota bacterium]